MYNRFCECNSHKVCSYCEQDTIESELEDCIMELEANKMVRNYNYNTSYPNVFTNEMYFKKLGSVL